MKRISWCPPQVLLAGTMMSATRAPDRREIRGLWGAEFDLLAEISGRGAAAYPGGDVRRARSSS